MSLLEISAVYLANNNTDEDYTINRFDRIFIIVVTAVWLIGHLILFYLIISQKLFKSWRKVELEYKSHKENMKNYLYIDNTAPLTVV